MKTKSDFEENFVELNEQLVIAAQAFIEKVKAGVVSLPAEIEGFEGLFLATSDDESIAAIGAVSQDNISYKIGTVKVSS